MLIRSALSDAKWLIAKGGTDRAEVLNRVMGKIDNVMKELDGVELIDLNKVWHQAKDVMPPRIYGGNHADLLCVHQFKPTSHPILTHEENCPEIPSQKNLLIIYGVGGTIDYVKENKDANKIPDKCIKALDKYLDDVLKEDKDKE